MPSNFLNADASFPQFTGEESDKEKLEKITGYLFLLLEQLRYALANLGVDNFNDAELSTLGRIITEPVYIQLRDAEGNIAALQVEAGGLTSRVTGAEGDISVLQQTAQGLNSRVSNAEGDISSLNQTAAGLTVRISDAEGNLTALAVTSGSLTSRISSAEGSISTLQQTATSLSSQLSSAQGELSALTQTAEDLTARVSSTETGLSQTLRIAADGVTITNANGSRFTVDGGQVNADNLNLTGAITWRDLSASVQNDIDEAYSMASDAQSLAEDVDDTVGGWVYPGTTYIDGGMLMTGTVMASSIQGGEVLLLDDREREAASLTLTGASSYSGRKLVIDSGAVEINGGSGDVFVSGGGGAYVQLSDEVILGGGDTRPNNVICSCGTSRAYWADVYSANEPIVVSDLTKKNSVVYGLDAYDALFDRLRPMSFLFNEGTSGRRHLGLGAQDVERALEESGLTSLDFAPFIKSPRRDEGGQETGEYDYALRYGELIALLIEQVQGLKKRVEQLEG